MSGKVTSNYGKKIPPDNHISFTLLYWNVQSILNKIDIINLLARQNKCDVFCITEHWLMENDICNLCIPGYQIASQFTRTLKIHGGSLILVKDGIEFILYDKITSYSEELTCEMSAVLLPSCNLIIVNVYRSPAGDLSAFYLKLNLIFMKILQTKLDLIFTADFNVNFLNIDPSTVNLQELISSFGLQITINDITRPSLDGIGGTCIDNILTNLHHERWKTTVFTNEMSDHNVLCFNAYLTSKLIKTTDLKETISLRRPINNFNSSHFIMFLNNINWSRLYSSEDIDSKFKIFLELFLWALDITIPLRSIVTNRKKVSTKWYHQGLIDLKKKLNYYYKLMNNSADQSDAIKNKYKECKKFYKKELKIAKLNYNCNLIVTSKNKIKTAWGLVKQSAGLNTKCSMNLCNFLSDDFNEYFINSVNEINKSISFSHKTYDEYLTTVDVNTISSGNESSVFSFKLNYIRVEEVYKEINNLGNSKCYDFYGINPCIIKLATHHICEVLTYLFNECIDQGVFPNVLKLNKVIPIYKKGSRDELKNYRPISIVPILSKVFEKLIYKQLIKYLEKHNLLSNRQFGFRKNCNTIEAIQQLISDCFEGVETKKSVVFRSYDMTKAFDTVEHNVLIDKLSFYGMHEQTLNLFKSYLENREQAVYLNGEFSSFLPVRCGVPQGSILGPILFILYINDLPSVLLSQGVQSYLFADDLGLSLCRGNYGEISANLFEQNKIIMDWCAANKLCINADKTSDIYINVSASPDNIKSLRFLGIIIQSNLKWNVHISNIAGRVAKGIFILRALQNSLSKEILLSVYYAYIHSLLSYGIVLWGNSPLLTRLFLLQKKAVRIVSRAQYNAHCKPLFSSLNILTLSSLYLFNLLLFIKSNLCCINVNANIHTYNTRNRHNLCTKRCKLTLTQSSFVYHGIKCFNMLPNHVKSLSYKQFKNRIKKFFQCKCLYNVEEFYTLDLGEL